MSTPQYKSSVKKIHNKVQQAQEEKLKLVIKQFILSKKTIYDGHVNIPQNFWNYLLHANDNEPLGIIGLSPYTKHSRNPLLDVARGIVYDRNLNMIVSVPMDERSNVVMNSIPLVNGSIKFNVTGEEAKKQIVYSKFNVPLSKVKLYPNYQGIYVRLIQHNGKVYFATNSRVKEYNPKVTPDPRYVYNTERYMRMFADASKILPEDVFDIEEYKYSNICHYFLLESKEFSKSTYKRIEKTTVYYLSSHKSYDNNVLVGVDCDTVNRYKNKLTTVDEISVEEANKLLSNGYTNNPTNIPLLSGGESVILEGENFGFRITPESFLWRRSFIEPEIFEDDNTKFLRALNTPSKFTYKLTLEEAFDHAGDLTWSDASLGESTVYNEAIQDRIISYILGCSFYDQIKVKDLYNKVLEEPLQYITEFLYKETAATIIGHEKPGDNVIAFIGKGIRAFVTELFTRANAIAADCDKNSLPSYECKDNIHNMLRTYNVSDLYDAKKALEKYTKTSQRINSRSLEASMSDLQIKAN